MRFEKIGTIRGKLGETKVFVGFQMEEPAIFVEV